MMAHKSFLLSLVITLPFLHLVNGSTFSIMSYGAKADGVTDNSAAFLKAWSAACSASQAATLYVPSGQFLLHPALFSGPCKNSKIIVQVDGNLIASTDYKLYGAAGYIMKFNNVKGLSFQGGYIDGKGSALWACKAGKGNCPYGARSLVFSNSRDITLTGLTSVNSELFHIVIDTCTNVKVDGLKITASSTSPNTDGIHVEQSTGVTITNSNIKTGDDCISIGSGTQNLWIEKIACGPGHGISVGSLGKTANEAGVQNVTVKDVVFTGSTNGLRIKSWARSSTGFAKGIVFDGATMNNVANPIIIDQHYCPNNQGCSNQNSGVKISQVTYNNIKGTSATQVAVDFSCSASAPCQGIKMSNVQLTYKGNPAKASCDHAFGSSSGSVSPPSCLKSSASNRRLLGLGLSRN
ncbi:polygalacturonase-like [Nymphaea colorata]|nr:polygalacturonase-like [Nymphaea colorata]